MNLLNPGISMSRYIGSLLLILLINNLSYGQSRFIPSAFRTGIDLIGVGYTILSSGYTHIEVNNDLQFGKYFFSLDLSSSSRTFSRDEFNYQYDGRFFRAGIDYNFIPNDPDNNVIFIGARYGRAYFNENVQFSIDDNIFGFQDYKYSNESLRGRWLEANGGMKIRVWNQLFLGYTLRLKFAGKVRGEKELVTYELPGYGKAARTNIFAFSYHILYRIPF